MKKRLLQWCVLVLALALGLAVHAQATETTPWLTVNGSTTSASAAFNEAPTIRVYAPGATAVRLLGERLYPSDPHQSWNRYFRRDEFSIFVEEDGMKMFDSGTWRITAAWTADDYADGTDLAEADIEWTPIGEGVTVEVADWIGRLDPPSASLSSAALTRGDILTATLAAFQDKGEWYWAELEKWNDDDWEYLDHIDTDLGENGNRAFSLPTIALEPGDYRLELCTEAVGYEDNRVALPFTLNESGETLPGMALYLPSVADGHALSFQQILVYGYAEGADRMSVEIRKEGEQNWRDDIWLDGDFDYRNWSSSDSGTYNFTLRAWWGDTERVLETPFTLVQSAPYGDLDEPDIQGINPIVPLGEGLSGSFSGVENAYDYHIRLEYRREDGDWEKIWESHPRAAGHGDVPIDFPALALARPGEYWLQVHAHALGYNGGHANREFLVTDDEGALSGDIALLFSRETMQACEGMTIYAYAPGAEYMSLDIRRRDDVNWRDGRDGEGEFQSWGWGCGSGGEYTFTLGAFYPEESGKAPAEVTRTFTVTSEGWLERPVLTGIPSVIFVGEDIHGSFQPIEGAQWYDIELQRVFEDGRWTEPFQEHRQPAAESSTDIDLDGSLFEEEGVYRLSVNASAVGVDNGYTECRILAIPEAESSDALTLKVYGKTEGNDDLMLFQHFPIVLETPEGVTAARVWDGWDWDHWAGPDEEFFREWNANWDGECTFVAQATTDPSVSQWLETHDDMDGFDWDQVDWSMTSNRLTLNVICLGELDPPEVELPGGNTVVRGEPLVFHFDAVENAAQYGVIIVPEGGDWDHNIYEGDSLTAGTFSIPTDAMAPGNYTLIIDPRHYGWRGHAIGYFFNVVEPADWTNEPSFHISRTEVQTNEPFECSVYAPGAEEVRVCHEELENPWKSGEEGILCNLRADWPGEYVFLAYARYANSDEWVQIGDAITVNATAPNGRLESTIAAPAAVPADQAYSFSVTWQCMDQWPDQAFIEIYDEADEHGGDLLQGLETQGLAETSSSDDGDSITYTYTLAAGALGVGSYRIEAGFHPAGYGYEWTFAERQFIVVASGEREIYTNLSDEYATMLTPHVIVTAPGAGHISMWVSKQSPVDTAHPSTRLALEGDGDTLEGEVLFGCYAAPRYVRVTAEYADGTSRTREMEVNVIAPLGRLGGSTLCMSGVWTEGQALCFRVETDNAWSCEVEVIDRGTGEEVHFEEGDCDDSGRMYCTIPAEKFAPGHLYAVTVFSFRQGYDMDDTTSVLGMMPANPTTLVLPAALTEVDEEAFAGTAAQRIVLPATVISVADRAFADCPNLLEVVIEDGASGISARAFEGSGAFLVYGRAGSSAAAYAGANPQATFIRLD